MERWDEMYKYRKAREKKKKDKKPKLHLAIHFS
jgi:hypothetical protein